MDIKIVAVSLENAQILRGKSRGPTRYFEVKVTLNNVPPEKISEFSKKGMDAAFSWRR